MGDLSSGKIGHVCSWVAASVLLRMYVLIVVELSGLSESS